MANRYQILGEIASGGMATVEYGRLFGAHGFMRPVAIKRLHAHFAKDPAFAAMFIDEARLSARLMHANIIQTLDVIERPGEIGIVMEYVHGETLAGLLERTSAQGELVPIKIAAALVSSVLHGLHAAHETRTDRDELLGVVHRDVSPQNILVGVDGVPRILDFGIAKAVDQLRSTPSGEIKGKLAYIAPEQLLGQAVDRRADVFGAAAVLWETLTSRMLFQADNSSVLVQRVLQEPIRAPSVHVAHISAQLDAIVMRGLARDREQRYASAREMALDLERKVGIATQSEVSDWMQLTAAEKLGARLALLRRLQESGGVALLGSEPREHAAQNTRVLESAEEPGSTPPSIETKSHATQVLSTWPWLVGGILVIVGLALFVTSWRRDAADPVIAPLAVPSKPNPPPPTAAAAAAPVAVSPSEALPTGLSPSAAGAPARAGTDARAPGRRVQSKRPAAKATVKTASNTPVQAAPIAQPKCSPVIYVDGIRRINPDCPQPVRPKQ